MMLYCTCAFSLTCPQTMFNKPIHKKVQFLGLSQKGNCFAWVCVLSPDILVNLHHDDL